MSTLYKVKIGQEEICGECGKTSAGGQQMIRLTSLHGERLGNCCLECYDEEQEDIWS